MPASARSLDQLDWENSLHLVGDVVDEVRPPPGGLALVETRSTPKGVLINTYRPAGSLPQGTLHPDNPSDAELARRKKLAAEGSGI